jgi:hypothetical protein
MTGRASISLVPSREAGDANVAHRRDMKCNATTPAAGLISPTSSTCASIVTLSAAMTETFGTWGESLGRAAKPAISARGVIGPRLSSCRRATVGFKTISAKVSDAYDRPARLYPGLMVLSPIAVLIVCLYGQEKVLMWGAITITAACGGAYVLCRIVRNAGQRLQSGLFEEWGGAPTTQLLRHGNKHFDIHTKERFHKALSKALGKKMPTSSGEAADPSSADELYRAAAAWLINHTRDSKKFPLVFKENVAFGFHRNALGLRPFGIGVALACLIWGLVHAWFQSAFPNVPAPVLISFAYSVLILSMWIFVLNEAALKRTGFSYAERLIQSLDVMKSAASVSAKASEGSC